MKNTTRFFAVVVLLITACMSVQAKDLTESQISDLKMMQRVASSKSEKVEIILGDLVTIEFVDSFRQTAWDMAGFAVENDADLSEYRYMLNELYVETFSTILQKRAEMYAEEFSLRELNGTVDVSDEWLWDNVDLTFRHKDTIMVVVASKSRDMQMSRNKASLEARSAFVTILRKIQHISDDESVSMKWSSIAASDIRASGYLYETVVLLKIPLAQNLE